MEELKIAENDLILFSRPNDIFVGRVIEVREKAVFVHFEWQPISIGYNAVTVYQYSIWFPKSVIIKDPDPRLDCLSVTKRFINYGIKAENIRRLSKKYFIEDSKQIFC